MIHKSFSKKDLIEIIHDYNMLIDNYTAHNKCSLSHILIDFIDNENNIDFKNNVIYPCKNKNELKEYLKNQNPNKLLNVSEKNKVMKFCKEVIYMCRNNCRLDDTPFNSYQEIYLQMKDLLIHGDIPSLRRACNLLNKSHKMPEDLYPIMSLNMQKKINDKERYKNKHITGLKVSHGHFVLLFD